MKKVILFDLDGTLVDTGPGIIRSLGYAMDKLGILVNDPTELHKFIGPPLRESFQQFYGLDQEQTELGVLYYREHYRAEGMYEVEFYPGMKELLERLKASGKTLAVATSKPEEFAIKILEKIDFAKYFSYICGSTLDLQRTTKTEVIAYALQCCAVTDFSSVVIVGDRKYDVFGAKQVGIDSIGVLFGYGNREELEQEGATWIAESAEEVFDIVSK